MNGYHGVLDIGNKIKRKSSFSRRDLGKRSFSSKSKEVDLTTTEDIQLPKVDPVASSNVKTAVKTPITPQSGRDKTTSHKKTDVEKPVDIMSRIRERSPDYTKYNERLERARRNRRMSDIMPKDEHEEISIHDEDEEYDDDDYYYDDDYAPQRIRFSLPRFKFKRMFRKSKKTLELDKETTTPG